MKPKNAKWETFSLAGFEQNIQMNRYRLIGLGDILHIIIYALIILIQSWDREVALFINF